MAERRQQLVRDVTREDAALLTPLKEDRRALCNGYRILERQVTLVSGAFGALGVTSVAATGRSRNT